MCTNNGSFLSSGISCNNAGTQLHSSWRQTCTQLYTVRYTQNTFGWHLQKLTANKISALYGTRRLIIAFTTARTCPCPKPDQPSPRLRIIFKKHFTSILPFTPSLQSGFYPSGVTTKNSVLIYLHNSCHMPCQSHPSWFDYPNILRLAQIMMALNTQPSPSSDTSPLRIKYIPQHPIFQHLWLMTFLSCDVRSST